MGMIPGAFIVTDDGEATQNQINQQSQQAVASARSCGMGAGGRSCGSSSCGSTTGSGGCGCGGKN